MVLQCLFTLDSRMSSARNMSTATINLPQGVIANNRVESTYPKNSPEAYTLKWTSRLPWYQIASSEASCGGFSGWQAANFEMSTTLQLRLTSKTIDYRKPFMMVF